MGRILPRPEWPHTLRPPSARAPLGSAGNHGQTGQWPWPLGGDSLGTGPPKTEASPPQDKVRVAPGTQVPASASPTHEGSGEEGLVNRSREKRLPPRQRTTQKMRRGQKEVHSSSAQAQIGNCIRIAAISSWSTEPDFPGPVSQNAFLFSVNKIVPSIETLDAVC